MLLSLRRAAGAAVAVLSLLVGVTAMGAAAAGSPVAITGIEVKDGNLIGLVSGADAAIDPSLTITVAGRAYPVDGITSGQGSPVARTAVIVVDTSGSMGADGMAIVRSSVAAFLKSVPNDVRVGVVSFSGKAQLDLAPTTNKGRVQGAVDGLSAKGETALYDGVDEAVRALGSKGERSILLLSDGGDTASAHATQSSVTAELRAAKIRTEAVAFKSTDGSANAAALRAFAAAGGGKVVSAANAGAVQSAFTSAAKTLASQMTFSMPLPPGVSAVQNVKVSGSANGSAFTATALVDFGAGVAPAQAEPTRSVAKPITGPTDETVASASPTTKVIGLPMPLLIAAGALFLGILGVALGFAGSAFKSGRQARVENIERYVAPGASTSRRAKASKTTALSESLVFIGEKVMEGRDSTSKTMAQIERADLPLRAGEWWLLRILAVVVGAAAVAVLFHGGPLLTLIAVLFGAVVGFFLPGFALRFLANRRGKKFDGQLPDVLTLVASSLSTGFSLPQALDAVAKDTADPAAKEFSRALAETRIGADIGDALERMASRMASENMRWTAMAIRIQREVGGNLAETLRTTAKTLREREELRRHVRALSAEGRLSAYILIALPIGIFFYTLKTNRSYIELLWSNAMGIAMIVAGLVSLAVGVFWMRKVVDVQV